MSHNLFQGKHSTLSTSWLSSQASNGWTQTRLPTCCNNYLKCACKFQKWLPLRLSSTNFVFKGQSCAAHSYISIEQILLVAIFINEPNASCYELICTAWDWPKPLVLYAISLSELQVSYTLKEEP